MFNVDSVEFVLHLICELLNYVDDMLSIDQAPRMLRANDKMHAQHDATGGGGGGLHSGPNFIDIYTQYVYIYICTCIHIYHNTHIQISRDPWSYGQVLPSVPLAQSRGQAWVTTYGIASLSGHMTIGRTRAHLQLGRSLAFLRGTPCPSVVHI